MSSSLSLNLSLLIILTLILLPLSTNSQSSCPTRLSQTDLHSDSITLGPQSSIPIQPGYDNKCYNYTLPSSFPRPPTIAIALNQFQAQPSSDLSFSIKPLPSTSTTLISFLIRTPWKYTNWTQITINFFAQSRQDIETGSFQKDTGNVGGCGLGKVQPLFFPFTEKWGSVQGLKVQVFLNGFQITTTIPQGATSSAVNSPYEIQLLTPILNETGLIVVLSVTTTTQINNVYISYFIFNPTLFPLKVEAGFLQKSNIQGNSIIQLNTTNSPPFQIKSGLYGFSGFIINSNNTPQLTILFNQNLNIMLNTFSNLINYLSFQYIILLNNPCFNCLNSPYLSNGNCVPSCPQNTAPTNGICQRCGANSYASGGKCVCQNGFYMINGVCTTCSTNERWNGKECMRCGSNAIWSGNVCVCITGYYNVSGSCVECARGQQWNGMACVDISGNQAFQNNQQQQQFVSQQNTQQNIQQFQTTNTNQNTNNTNQNYQTTTTNTNSNNANSTGPNSCPAGVANWNTQSQTCVCILSGFSWNGKSCVQSSSPPSSTQSQSQSSNSQNCPPSISTWNGQQCVCNQQGYYFNGQTCISNFQQNSNNQQTQTNQYQQPQTQLQTQNYQQNQLQTNQQNQYQTSNTNQYQSSTQSLNNLNCPANSGASWNGQQCVCNQQSYYFNGQVCVPGQTSNNLPLNTPSPTYQSNFNTFSQSNPSSPSNTQSYSLNQQNYNTFNQNSPSTSSFNQGTINNFNTNTNMNYNSGGSSGAQCPYSNMIWNGISCVCMTGYSFQGGQCLPGGQTMALSTNTTKAD